MSSPDLRSAVWSLSECNAPTPWPLGVISPVVRIRTDTNKSIIALSLQRQGTTASVILECLPMSGTPHPRLFLRKPEYTQLAIAIGHQPTDNATL